MPIIQGMKTATHVVDPEGLAARARDRELVGSALAEALATLPDASGIDLAGADLSGAQLPGLTLFKANLSGASLRGANLEGAELSGTDFTGADLEGARLTRAGLGMTVLSGVNAFRADLSGATLTGATMAHAVFHLATLTGARIREADLTGADFRSADMREAELSLCRTDGACFDEADLRGARLRAVKGYESASWYGVDIRDINFAGAYRLRRHVVDENYLREFREAGRLEHALYRFWWLTSDCGRSLGRWLANIAVVVAVFAGLFAWVGVNTGDHPPGVMTHLYYSVVTLTSLGYGDILPQSALGQALVMLEVCVGYMMLGGLISILANKMARRAE